MYTVLESPAWDPKGEPRIMATKCTTIKVFEEVEGDRLKVSSNYPTGNNVSIYLSVSGLNEFFDKLPNKFRASSIDGLVPTKRKLLMAFLMADPRFGCCLLRKGGYTYVLKRSHPLYSKCLARRKGAWSECY